MWIIQAPTSSLFPASLPRIRARSELFNVSVVPPYVKFYTALPVSIVGSYFAQGIFSHVDYMWSYSLTEPTWRIPCLPLLLIIAFRSFFAGVCGRVFSSPGRCVDSVASDQNTAEVFLEQTCSPGGCPKVTVAVTGVVPSSGLPVALRLPIPPKYLL
jgi:hypothetical protein